MSVVPSQSSSMPLHVSLAPGFTLGFESSQSVVSATVPVGAEHAIVGLAASPKPSPSASAHHGSASIAATSAVPSQSSSTLLQTSVPDGLTVALVSSQSVGSVD